MIFSVIVSSHPALPASDCAISFCKAIVTQEFRLHKIFFLGEGVLNSSPEHPISSEWESFGQRHHVESICCISSSLKYGLVGSHRAEIEKPESYFVYSGLGQLIDATARSNRVISFGQRNR